MSTQPPYALAWQLDRMLPGIWNYVVPRVNWALESGGTVSSWYRSRSDNVRVGGSLDSQHLVGLAFDVVGGDAARFRAAGFEVIEYPGHVHVQTYPAGVLRRAGVLDALNL